MRNKKLVLSTISAPLLLMTLASNATQIANQDDTLIVTASRTEGTLWQSPVSMQVVDRETIIKQAGDSIAESLRDIPGLEVYDNGLAGRKQIRIRGDAPSRVLVLIDGQELAYQRSGHNSGLGLLIDESAIERIEVVKGPHSVLYGSQAMGGVINIITRKGGDSAIGGDVNVSHFTATDGWQESGAIYGKSGEFSYRLNASYNDQQDRKTPNGRIPHSNFRNHSQGAWLGYQFGQQHVGLSLDRFDLSANNYTFDETKKTQLLIKIPKLQREKIALFYDVDFQDSVVKKLHIDGYQQKVERDFHQNINISNRSTMQINNAIADQHKTKGINLQMDFIPFENDLLIAGFQYLNEKASQTLVSQNFLIPSGKLVHQENEGGQWKQQSSAFFTQNTLNIIPELTWTIGARQSWLKTERISDQSDFITPRSNPELKLPADSKNKNKLLMSTSLTWSGIENTHLRMSYSQGYIFPTMAHLYLANHGHDNVIIFGNPDLKPETSDNYEIGMRYNDSQFLVDTAIYYSKAKNFIDSTACDGSGPCSLDGGLRLGKRLYYINRDKANTYGMELSVEYKGLSRVTPYISSNLLRREVTLDGRATYGSGEPTLTGRMGLKSQFDIFSATTLTPDLFIRAAGKATDRTDSEETKYHPGWATFNFALTTQTNNFMATLMLNNLLNKDYQTAHENLDAAKFNAVLKLGLTF